jgi:hypothetical protein
VQNKTPNLKKIKTGFERDKKSVYVIINLVNGCNPFVVRCCGVVVGCDLVDV